MCEVKEKSISIQRSGKGMAAQCFSWGKNNLAVKPHSFITPHSPEVRGIKYILKPILALSHHVIGRASTDTLENSGTWGVLLIISILHSLFIPKTAKFLSQILSGLFKCPLSWFDVEWEHSTVFPLGKRCDSKHGEDLEMFNWFLSSFGTDSHLLYHVIYSFS